MHSKGVRIHVQKELEKIHENRASIETKVYVFVYFCCCYWRKIGENRRLGKLLIPFSRKYILYFRLHHFTFTLYLFLRKGKKKQTHPEGWCVFALYDDEIKIETKNGNSNWIRTWKIYLFFSLFNNRSSSRCTNQMRTALTSHHAKHNILESSSEFVVFGVFFPSTPCGGKISFSITS